MLRTAIYSKPKSDFKNLQIMINAWIRSREKNKKQTDIVNVSQTLDQENIFITIFYKE